MKMKMRISGSILLVILLAGCAVQPESISVESDCVVDVGSTAPIDWTVFPEDAGDQTLTFVSSDEAVATVDESGAVTGISPGSATVTASAANGVTAKVSVIVVLAVEKVSAEGSLTLEIGQTGRVNAHITPVSATDPALTYASEDARIAAVDETGLVTALSAGKTTVSVTAHNGRKATISVTVEIPVSGVTLGQSELMMHIGESQTLVADVTPADAAHRALIWKSSDSDVAAVDETGCVTALKEGKAAITATAGNGVSASCRITVAKQNTGSATGNTNAGRPAPPVSSGGNPTGGVPTPPAPATPAPQAPVTPVPLTDAQIEQAIGEATGYAAGLGFNIVGERQPGHSIASVAYYDYGAFLQNLKDNVDYVASLLAGEDLSLAKLCFVREGTSVYVTYG